jgi:hypothetical protein
MKAMFEPLTTLRGLVMNLLSVSRSQTTPACPSTEAVDQPIRLLSGGPFVARAKRGLAMVRARTC